MGDSQQASGRHTERQTMRRLVDSSSVDAATKESIGLQAVSGRRSAGRQAESHGAAGGHTEGGRQRQVGSRAAVRQAAAGRQAGSGR